VWKGLDNRMAREGFVVYHEILKWMDSYDDAERGRLFTAMLKYSMTGEDPELRGNERFLWPAIEAKIDESKKSYEKTCFKNKKNAEKRYDNVPDDATACDRMPPHATACDSVPDDTTVYDRIPNIPTRTRTITGTGTITETETGTIRERTHAHGEYGWVKLTDEQYQRLLTDLGQEELDRCIKYVDESAQSTGNRNKWKDWNLTVRKCHRDGWGRKKQITSKADDLSDSYSMMERWANG